MFCGQLEGPHANPSLRGLPLHPVVVLVVIMAATLQSFCCCTWRSHVCGGAAAAALAAPRVSFTAAVQFEALPDGKHPLIAHFSNLVQGSCVRVDKTPYSNTYAAKQCIGQY